MDTTIKFTIIIDGENRMDLTLAATTTFEDLNEYIVDQKDEDPSIISYTFFKDQGKTIALKLTNNLYQENIVQGAKFYAHRHGGEPEPEPVPEPEPETLKINIVMKNNQNLKLELQPSITLNQISDYISNKLQQRQDRITYSFFHDIDYGMNIPSFQTLTQAQLTNGSEIYAQAVFPSIKIKIFKNNQETSSIEDTIDKSINDIIQILRFRNIIELYQQLSVTTQQGQDINNFEQSLWKVGIYDNLEFRFVIPVQRAPIFLQPNQKEFKNQTVSILNNGRTVFYSDNVRQIETILYLERAIIKQISLKKKEMDDSQTFTINDTKVAFQKDGNGIFVFWKGGELRSKFFIDC